MKRYLPFFFIITILLLIVWDIPFEPSTIKEPVLELNYQLYDIDDLPIQSDAHLDTFCPFCESEPIIHPGQVSNELPDILQFLASHGYYKGEITTLYSLDAVDAIKTFQLDSEILVDGIIGKDTWGAIGNSASTVPVSLKQPDTENLSLFIDLWQRQLTLFADGSPYKTYPIAIGKSPTPSPVGQWKISAKLYMGGAFGPRFLRLSVPWGNYGIHGTNKPWSIGTAASAGCIRLQNKDILEIFNWVKVGTPVTIYNGPFPKAHFNRPVLQLGSVGSAVYEVQTALKDMGYITFNPDGRYGNGTFSAIKKLQADYNLPATGTVSGKIYDLLGLYIFD